MPTNKHILYSVLDNASLQSGTNMYCLTCLLSLHQQANTKTETAQTINRIRLIYQSWKHVEVQRSGRLFLLVICVNGGHQPNWSVCPIHFSYQRVLSCCVCDREGECICMLCSIHALCQCVVCVYWWNRNVQYILIRKLRKTAKQLDQYFKKTTILKPCPQPPETAAFITSPIQKGQMVAY